METNLNFSSIKRKIENIEENPSSKVQKIEDKKSTLNVFHTFSSLFSETFNNPEFKTHELKYLDKSGKTGLLNININLLRSCFNYFQKYENVKTTIDMTEHGFIIHEIITSCYRKIIGDNVEEYIEKALDLEPKKDFFNRIVSQKILNLSFTDFIEKINTCLEKKCRKAAVFLSDFYLQWVFENKITISFLLEKKNPTENLQLFWKTFCFVYSKNLLSRNSINLMQRIFDSPNFQTHEITYQSRDGKPKRIKIHIEILCYYFTYFEKFKNSNEIIDLTKDGPVMEDIIHSCYFIFSNENLEEFLEKCLYLQVDKLFLAKLMVSSLSEDEGYKKFLDQLNTYSLSKELAIFLSEIYFNYAYETKNRSLFEKVFSCIFSKNFLSGFCIKLLQSAYDNPDFQTHTLKYFVNNKVKWVRVNVNILGLFFQFFLLQNNSQKLIDLTSHSYVHSIVNFCYFKQQNLENILQFIPKVLELNPQKEFLFRNLNHFIPNSFEEDKIFQDFTKIVNQYLMLLKQKDVAKFAAEFYLNFAYEKKRPKLFVKILKSIFDKELISDHCRFLVKKIYDDSNFQTHKLKCINNGEIKTIKIHIEILGLYFDCFTESNPRQDGIYIRRQGNEIDMAEHGNIIESLIKACYFIPQNLDISYLGKILDFKPKAIFLDEILKPFLTQAIPNTIDEEAFFQKITPLINKASDKTSGEFLCEFYLNVAFEKRCPYLFGKLFSYIYSKKLCTKFCLTLVSKTFNHPSFKTHTLKFGSLEIPVNLHLLTNPSAFFDTLSGFGDRSENRHKLIEIKFPNFDHSDIKDCEKVFNNIIKYCYFNETELTTEISLYNLEVYLYFANFLQSAHLTKALSKWMLSEDEIDFLKAISSNHELLSLLIQSTVLLPNDSSFFNLVVKGAIMFIIKQGLLLPGAIFMTPTKHTNDLKEFVRKNGQTISAFPFSKIDPCKIQDKVLDFISSSCPNIKTLVLKDCKHISVECLQENLKKLPFLEKLVITNCKKIDENIIPEIISLKKLTYLSLFDNKWVELETLSQLRKLTSLKVLDLSFDDEATMNRKKLEALSQFKFKNRIKVRVLGKITNPTQINLKSLFAEQNKEIEFLEE